MAFPERCVATKRWIMYSHHHQYYMLLTIILGACFFCNVSGSILVARRDRGGGGSLKKKSVHASTYVTKRSPFFPVENEMQKKLLLLLAANAGLYSIDPLIVRHELEPPLPTLAGTELWRRNVVSAIFFWFRQNKQKTRFDSNQQQQQRWF